MKISDKSSLAIHMQIAPKALLKKFINPIKYLNCNDEKAYPYFHTINNFM
ncbi:hypothetical protein MARI151_50347 [Maribacter litoralis]|uniref:Uncharacterized protein n=1 Tax=Maribacter litoralis TaxID=2059726 RepID=A0A653V3V1_9FLAO|nr:hypothetical protein MARI151_50347 [Maribacter litoralis]